MMIARVQMVLYGMTTSRDVNGNQLHVALIAVKALVVLVMAVAIAFPAVKICLMETTNLAMVAMFMSPAPMK